MSRNYKSSNRIILICSRVIAFLLIWTLGLEVGEWMGEDVGMDVPPTCMHAHMGIMFIMSACMCICAHMHGLYLK